MKYVVKSSFLIVEKKTIQFFCLFFLNSTDDLKEEEEVRQ